MQSGNFFQENICNGIDLCVEFTGIKCDAFVNLSTTTTMESCVLIVIGNPIIKSMEMTSHFHSESGKVAINLLDVDAQPSPADILCT